jgi:hypothetical protein
MPKISALTAATSVAGADLVPIVQGGVTKKLPASYLTGGAQTAAEQAASVTPVNYAEMPGSVLRYGDNAVPGTTDMTAAIQAAIDQHAQGGPAVLLPPDTCLVSSALTLPSKVSIRGHGNGRSKISYSGSAQAFKSATPGTRIYNILMRDLQIEDAGTGTIGLDLDSVSEGYFENLTINGFTTGVKVYSPTTGYAVYNRFVNVKALNCTTGLWVTGTSSNANTFIACRGAVCTTGALVDDSNETLFLHCQFEACTDGVELTASTAGISPRNCIMFCRFENNTGYNIIIGADVSQTALVMNSQIDNGDTGNISDSGTKTQILDTHADKVNLSLINSQASTSGPAFYFERESAAGTSVPVMKVKDSNTGSGTPQTLEIATERNAGVSLAITRGGVTYYSVDPAGRVTLQSHRSGTAAPTANAGYVGEIFVDTTNDDAYMAIQTGAGASDWKKITP